MDKGLWLFVGTTIDRRDDPTTLGACAQNDNWKSPDFANVYKSAGNYCRMLESLVKRCRILAQDDLMQSFGRD